MKRFNTLMSVIVISFALLALTIQMAAQQQEHSRPVRYPVRYNVIDLGILGSAVSYSFPYDISNKGQLVGISNPPGTQQYHAFAWADGTLTDLGTLGGPASYAYAINEAGAVAGFSTTSTPDPFFQDTCSSGSLLEPYTCNAVVWFNGQMLPLPTLGGNNSWARAINNRFQVGGAAEILTADTSCQTPHQNVLQARPVTWGDGEVQELPTYPGDSNGTVIALNDRGQAIGISGDCTYEYYSRHALLWDRGTVTDLGNLGGSFGHIAYNINNQGQVVGQSSLPGDTERHAFLWENGVMRDLPVLPGCAYSTFSVAYGINKRSEVVGSSCGTAVLWRDGAIVDLNTLIPAGSPLQLTGAIAINDRGEIVGVASVQTTIDRRSHAFLATPIPSE